MAFFLKGSIPPPGNREEGRTTVDRTLIRCLTKEGRSPDLRKIRWSYLRPRWSQEERICVSSSASRLSSAYGFSSCPTLDGVGIYLPGQSAFPR